SAIDWPTVVGEREPVVLVASVDVEPDLRVGLPEEPPPAERLNLRALIGELDVAPVAVALPAEPADRSGQLPDPLVGVRIRRADRGPVQVGPHVVVAQLVLDVAHGGPLNEGA